jgi:hypothetical protein
VFDAGKERWRRETDTESKWREGHGKINKQPLYFQCLRKMAAEK